MRDLFGVRMSSGTVDAIYADAGRRLAGFITALVATLRTLAVVHVDETSDRVGTVMGQRRTITSRSERLNHISDALL